MGLVPPTGGRTLVAVAATFLLLVTWTPPSAQSLADVARAEAARRAAVQESGRVITDKDLRPAPSPSVPQADAAPASRSEVTTDGAAATDDEEATKDPDERTDTGEAPERRDEQYWRTRFTATRQAGATANDELAAVPDRLRQLDRELDADPPPARRLEIAREQETARKAIEALQRRAANVQAEMSALERFAASRKVPAAWTQ